MMSCRILLRFVAVTVLAGLPIPRLHAQGTGSRSEPSARSAGQLPAAAASEGFPPLAATDAYVERFSADIHCVPGTRAFPGFDLSVGSTCGVPSFFHPSAAGVTFNQVRNLAYGITSNQPPSPNHWAVSFTDAFDGSGQNNFSEGMSNCNPGAYDCGIANEVGAYVGPGGFGYFAGAGGPHYLWGRTASAPVVPGSTDDGPDLQGGHGGWAPPATGVLFHVALRYPGDGTLVMSVFPARSLCAGGSCGTIFRVPITYPAGAIHQFFARGSGSSDYVTNVAEADGVNLRGQPPAYDETDGGMTGGIEGNRWALHLDGSEWDYRTPASDLMTVWEWDSHPRDASIPRPWVVIFRGQENTIVSVGSTYNRSELIDALLQSGVVVVAIDFHTQVYYGGPQEVQDVAMALAKVKASMNLASRPFAFADSAGGINLFNAITHGALLPRAAFCFSCNLSLAADANGQGGMANQMTRIQADYGFANAAQYATATAGYDPLLVLQNPGTRYASASGTDALLPSAAQTAASVPFHMYADPSDPIVNTSLNSVPMCAAINALHPGNCTLDLSKGGGHVGAQEFPPTEILNLLHAMP